MYKGKKIGVVVPAYNEERFIASVIETMPDYVDRIYVVNDASIDRTPEIVTDLAKQNTRVILVNRTGRGGVGAAIISGHEKALEDEIDIVAVMAGDGQMTPAFLTSFLDPIVEGNADYTKGNRLSRPEHKKEMPAWRAFGNFLLTGLTRIASGYWHISDPQNGYTAISRETLRKLDLHKLERGFAFENDMLVKLKVVGARVVDVPHPAVYRGQQSKIHYSNFIVKTSWVLFKDYTLRIYGKYTHKHISDKSEARPIDDKN